VRLAVHGCSGTKMRDEKILTPYSLHLFLSAQRLGHGRRGTFRARHVVLSQNFADLKKHDTIYLDFNNLRLKATVNSFANITYSRQRNV